MLIKTENLKAVKELLKEDELVNLNIVGIIENMPGIEVYVDNVNNPKGVFIEDQYMHYLSSKDNNFIDEVCTTFFKDGFYGFSGLEESITDRIRKKYDVTWENPCTLYYLPKENLNLNLIKNPVSSLDIKDAETVYKHYEFRHPGVFEAIKDDILKRPSSAIYIDGELVSWVLVHKDNSMGIMYTKEEHRGKGYAVDVTIDLASKIINSGKIPYLQIITWNNMSPGLAKKCGFIKCGQVSWCGIMAGLPKEIVDANNQARNKFLETLNEDEVKIFFKHRHNYYGMYLFLHSLEDNVYDEEEFILKEVKSDEDFKVWLQVSYEGYKIYWKNYKDTNGTLLKGLYAEESNYTLYIGVLKGKPVSCSATLKVDEDFSGLTILSVNPEYRNQGIGKKTITFTLNAEKSKRINLIALQSPKEYSNGFKKIGFKISNEES